MTRQVALFAAGTPETGSELWITDGTAEGTRLLKQLLPGPDGSAPSDFTDLGDGRALFVASGGASGSALWVTDGTPAGTHPAVELNASGDTVPALLTGAVVHALGDGRALFTGVKLTDDTDEAGVFVTDGTQAGTSLLLDAWVGGPYIGPTGYTSLGDGRVLFSADTGTGGEELWATDGTGGGTVPVTDLAPGGDASSLGFITPLGDGTALFIATDGNGVRSLYATDGSMAGTERLASGVDAALVPLGGSGETPASPGRALFTVTRDDETTPWLTDGTPGGTVPIAGVDLDGADGPGVTLGNGETLFVGGSGGSSGLWITDGTPSGTLRLASLGAATVSVAALDDGRALVAADDGQGVAGVLVSDGTPGGTVPLRAFAGFEGEALTALGDGRFVFAAKGDADGPVVPWVTDGTVAGTLPLSDADDAASAATGFTAVAVADLPVVSITAAAVQDEGDGGTAPFTLTLTRTGDLDAPLGVDYRVVGVEGPNGRPAVAADFAGGALPSGTAAFAAGSATARVVLDVAGDTVYGPDKLFTLALSGGDAGLSVALDADVSGTIHDDDTGILIRADAAERAEGNPGATTAFTFTVTRLGDAGAALTIPYTVSGAGANPASAAQFKDGRYPSGSVLFAAGAREGKITVQVRGDTVFEPDMTFAVALSDPAAPVTFSSRSATATIRNDDAPAVLRITATDADKTEAGAAASPFRFTVTRTGDVAGEFSVGYVVTGTGDNPATAADFASGTALSAAILFLSRSATPYDLYLFGADNLARQPDRTFSVTLSPTPYAQIASGTASGVIRDDDLASPPPADGGTETGGTEIGGGTQTGGGTETGGGTGIGGGTSTVSVAPLDASKAEGDAGITPFTFLLTRTGDLGAAGTVAYRVTGAGANPAAAYQFAGGAPPSGTIAFAPGQTGQVLTVHVASNQWEDPDAAFQVSLDVLSGNIFLGTAAAAGVIRNDDAYQAVPQTAPGGGAAQDTAGDQRYVGTGGADVVRVGSGVRGTVVSLAPNGDVYLGHAGQTDALRGIEAVRFIDGRLVFDPADPAARVARLYQAGLGRAPDQDGLGYWTDAVQNGATLGQLAASFLGSPEFVSRFGQGLGDAEFVQRLYQNVLGRAPDPSGQGYWTGVLARGVGRADVLTGIAESAENRQTTAPLVQSGLWHLDPAAAQAARMYDTVLGRLPDAAGLAYWTGALGGGSLGLQDMADGFVASPEFQATYGALSNRDFVAEIYANTLRRPGDAAGVDYWTARLDEGATRAGLVVGFSESAEHRQLTAVDILGNTPGQYGIATA